MKHPVLDAGNRRRSPAAPVRTAVLRVRVRVRDILILARGGGRRRVRPVGRVRRLEPAADLLMPRVCPVLQLVLLHPVLGAVDDGRCLRFLDGRTCSALRARRPRRRGFGLLVLHGQAAHSARRRQRRRERRQKRRLLRWRRGQGRFAFDCIVMQVLLQASPPQPTSICAEDDWRVDGVFASGCWLWIFLSPA